MNPPRDLAPYYRGGYYAYQPTAGISWTRAGRFYARRKGYSLYNPSQDGAIRVVLTRIKTAVVSGSLEVSFHLPPAVPNGLLLDVGCGSGRYLDRARSLGWETHGVEPSREAAEIANANGHKVVVGDIAQIDYPTKSFDYIQFWHSLEHIRDPINTLRRARSWLTDTGTIGIAAPNADGLGAFLFGDHWFNLDAPRHLFAFGPTSVARLLADSGFLVTGFETYSHLSDWTYSLRLGGSDRDRLVASVLAIFPMRVILGLVERLADLAGRGEHVRVSARPV